MVGCLDYEGRFSILDRIRGQNPLLKTNMKTIFQLKFKEIIKKFI